jgi:hypothetical protein
LATDRQRRRRSRHSRLLAVLFRNDDKDPNDNQDRDYFGSLDVEGTEYWLSGWVRTSRKTGKKYLSLSVKPKQDKPPASKKSRAEDFEDEIAR